MTGIALMRLDGVLRSSDGAIIRAGHGLYTGLCEIYRVVILATRDLDETWLRINGLTAHQFVIYPEPGDPADEPARRVRQIQRLRSRAEVVELVVDPDPAVAAAVCRVGVPVLHYVDPPYARPEFLPDYTSRIRPWDQMVADLEAVRAARAADTRPLEVLE